MVLSYYWREQRGLRTIEKKHDTLTKVVTGIFLHIELLGLIEYLERSAN